MVRNLAITISLLLVSCSALKIPCPCDAREDIMVGGRVIKMETEIWLNKIPATDRGVNKNTYVIFKLFTEDGMPFPEGILAEMYLLRPSDESFGGYEGTFAEVEKDGDGLSLVLKDNNGPKWDSGKLVDIAVLVVDKNGSKQFIKDDKVEITAIY